MERFHCIMNLLIMKIGQLGSSRITSFSTLLLDCFLKDTAQLNIPNVDDVIRLADSALQCKMMCKAHALCLSFVYRTSDSDKQNFRKRCNLKSGYFVGKPAKGVVSGLKECDGGKITVRPV